MGMFIVITTVASLISFFAWFLCKCSDAKELTKKIIKWIMIISFICLAIGLVCAMATSDHSEKDPMDAYDYAMAGYDWGDDYYYNRKDHEVQKKPWK